nr:PREDICTED: rho GTPase-activating protein 44 [Latimeria chalumnae]|eukprot:XP_014340145.1 PREDICTED: rho GTPase-activating protein 44 [Latimeria chalumnae]
MEKPSFGKPLQEHLSVSGREIAFPIEACVTMLLDRGMQEEGLFRVAPSSSKLKKLKASLDCGVLDVQEYSIDPHAIAGALKSYLRELPEPLMTFELYEEWIQASNIQDQDKRLQALWNACENLPKANYHNFRYLIKFLAKLTEHQDMNKMTPGNIAIVLGPNLLWPQAEGNITELMTTVSLQIVGIIEPIIQHADWFFPGEIEFNVTGNYGSPIHTNHNANYSSMPSPDMDHSERKQHDLTRRPLSVATDNMMLEFYKKDGMGVRVFDPNWVTHRGSSSVRKASSTPPAMQPPAPPSEPAAPPQSLTSEPSLDTSATPSPILPPSSSPQAGAERTSTDVSSYWSDSCYTYPSPEDDRPPPYPCYLHSHHYHPKAQPSARPEAPSPYRWMGYSPTLPPSPQQLDINSNPKPCSLRLPKQSSLTESHAPETNASPLYIKTPLVLTKQDSFGIPMVPPMSASPPWVSCACARDRGTRLTSTLKSKELSPVAGHKGIPSSSQMTASNISQQGAMAAQTSTDLSPHAMRKAAAKKLVPIPPKVPFVQSGSMSDHSAGQPSPISLSPTPPSTPSPYGLNYPQGYSLPSSQVSPAASMAAQSLSSPPSQMGTLPKSRPTPKLRQRPTLPPPEPPTVSLPASSPQPLDPTVLDGMSPGDSMSTDIFSLQIPSIHIDIDTDFLMVSSEQTCGSSVSDMSEKADTDEESESTAL